MISPSELKKYQIIYKRYFGIDLNNAEAYGQAIKLLNLYRIIINMKKNERRIYAHK